MSTKLLKCFFKKNTDAGFAEVPFFIKGNLVVESLTQIMTVALQC